MSIRRILVIGPIWLGLLMQPILANQDSSYYTIDTIYPVHHLDPFLEIIIDTNHTYTKEDVLKNESLAIYRLKDIVYQGMRGWEFLDYHNVYWGKIKVKSNAAMKDWFLHLEDEYIPHNAWLKGNGKVDVYGYVGNQEIFHYISGINYKKKEKKENPFWNLSRVPLPLPKDSLVELLIRLETSHANIPVFFNATIRHPDFQNYHPYYTHVHFINTFLLGVTFIIFVYYVLRYLYTRERIFLNFSFWVLSSMIAFGFVVGYSSEFLIANLPRLRFPLWVFFSGFLPFSFWLFGRSFVSSKEKYQTLDKFVVAFLWVLIIELVIMTLMAYFKISLKAGSISIHHQLISVFSIVGLVFSVIFLFKKDSFAKYFGLGALIGSIGFIISGLWAAGIIRLSVDPFAITVLIQIITFSFGISYRQQQIAKDNEKVRSSSEQSRMEISKMKDLNQIKTKFFANISHEFRTPLALIRGPLDQAYKNSNQRLDADFRPVTIDQKSYQIIEKNTARLEILVDQLLELSKLDSGQVILNVSQGSIIQFLKSVIFSFESMAERASVSFNTNFPKEISSAFYDMDKLEKITTNLISNAIKFTPQGGSVSINIEHEKDHLIMEFSDTGKGIRQEDIQKIFDRFYQVEGTEEKGSGIGLALTKELVDLLNGQISVSSTQGLGTTFKVRIPVTLPLLPDSKLIVSGKGTTANYISIPSLSINAGMDTSIGANVNSNKLPLALIVEDNYDLRQFIQSVLQKNYRVISASDGLQGERMAFEHIPEIVISDVMMPGQDGFALCNSLKRNIKTSHIPIILLTAKAGQENLIAGLTQGADAYITKPFDTGRVSSADEKYDRGEKKDMGSI